MSLYTQIIIDTTKCTPEEAPLPRPPKARYELRALYHGPRGGVTRIRTGTMWSDDPHVMAVALWAHAHREGPRDMKYDVVDHCTGTKLGVVVTYEELVKRAGSITAPTGTP
jgi:hypothetical protein